MFYLPTPEELVGAFALVERHEKAQSGELGMSVGDFATNEVGPFMRKLMCGAYMDYDDGRKEFQDNWEEGASASRYFVGGSALVLFYEVCFRGVTPAERRIREKARGSGEGSADPSEDGEGRADA